MVFGVINLGKHHVDGEFPVAPIPQMPPFNRVHGGMSRDSPVYLDRAQPGFSSDTSASLHMGVVSRVLDIRGHYESFLGPICLVGTVLRVPKIDVVIEGVVGDVVNEAWKWDRALVFFVSLLWVFIVNLGVLVIAVLRHGQHAVS